MPDIGRVEVLDCMKAFNPDARIILSSGYSRARQVEQIVVRGCSGFLKKPCQIRDIPKKLREILNT